MVRFRKKMFRVLAFSVVIFAFIAGPGTAMAQDTIDSTFEDYVNYRIRDIVAKKISESSLSRQVETPSASANTTSLVDKTSASDLFGIALNPAGFTQGIQDSSSSTSGMITTTFYALTAAIENRDPLDPSYYYSNGFLRRLSLGYGFDDPDSSAKKLQLYSFKVVVWSDRDPAASSNADRLNNITSLLGEGSTEYGKMQKSITQYFRTKYALSDSSINYLKSHWYNSSDMLSLVDRQFIENEIESRIKTFVATERSTLKVLEELRNAPEVSLSMKIKTDGSKRKYASLGLACEGGYSNNFEWILNGSYIEEEMLSGVRNKSGNLACEVEYNTGGSDLDRGDRLLKVSGSFAASWSKAYTPIYNYQIKIVLPAAKGFELPLVFRWNMGSLLDEGTFTARLGAALDLAQVLGSSR